MPRILVIADDFTGAAEIGGIAHLFGLSVGIMHEFPKPFEYKDDVLIIDTNSRRLEPVAASGKITEALKDVNFSKIDLVYKKVDSIIRGPVESEIRALMSIANKHSAVLIPANPSKGRVIKNGKYYVNDVPINKTDFVNDPEYPRKSDRIKDLIVDASDFIFIGDLNIHSERNRIFVPDLYLLEHFSPIINKISVKTSLPAGGADFFRALLQQKLNLVENRNYSFTNPAGRKHFIIGSKSESSNQTMVKLAKQGYACFSLPEGALEKENLYLQWEGMIMSSLKEGKNILINRPLNPIDEPKAIHNIIKVLAQATKTLIENCSYEDEIYVEGGETASDIFKNIKNSHARIKEAIADGVVKLELKPMGICLTVKPGSYIWPEKILKS